MSALSYYRVLRNCDNEAISLVSSAFSLVLAQLVGYAGSRSGRYHARYNNGGDTLAANESVKVPISYRNDRWRRTVKKDTIGNRGGKFF